MKFDSTCILYFYGKRTFFYDTRCNLTKKDVFYFIISVHLKSVLTNEVILKEGEYYNKI